MSFILVHTVLVNAPSHTTGVVHRPQAAQVAFHLGTVPKAGPEAAVPLATGAVEAGAIAVGGAAAGNGRGVGAEVQAGVRALTLVTA